MPSRALYDPRSVLLARKAKAHGFQNSLRIVYEAYQAGIPVSLAFALVEQESRDGSNVFGHDPTIYSGAGTVTKAKYLAYKRARGRTRMQGVGPCQLTWWETQDKADRLGGCWVPKYNIRVAFQTLAALIRAYGYTNGIRRYNGAGSAAVRYAEEVKAKQRKWHTRLT